MSTTGQQHGQMEALITGGLSGRLHAGGQPPDPWEPVHANNHVCNAFMAAIVRWHQWCGWYLGRSHGGCMRLACDPKARVGQGRGTSHLIPVPPDPRASSPKKSPLATLAPLGCVFKASCRCRSVLEWL